MDNSRVNQTTGESSASDHSGTASCRPCNLPATSAVFFFITIASSATPFTWYAPASSSASLVGDYSQSPAAVTFLTRHDFIDFLKCNEVAAYNFFQNQELYQIVSEIRHNPSQFERYCHHGELVRFLNQFADPQMNLPAGWEKRFDAKGRLYFIDLNSRTTTFIDPRLPVGETFPGCSHSGVEACSENISSPSLPPPMTVQTQSNSVTSFTSLNKSAESKRRLSPSQSIPDPKQAKLILVDKAENETSKDSGTQDLNDNRPPRLSFEVPKSRDLPGRFKDWNDVELPIDFLLLTVEDCEFLGCFYYLEKPFKSYCRDIGPVYFGFMGDGSNKKLKIALIKCSKGSAVPGGSLTVVKNAVRVLRPKAVFSVGACSGLSRGKVKLGDVVVSSKLTTPVYKTPASRDIGPVIRHAADGWNAPLANPDALEVRVHCDGEVLSRPEAVGEDIIQRCPEALAVELEGEGVFAAAHDLKTEWVVVKGIKDYADGSQPSSDEWGRFASVMAASVVANILSDPVVFEEWPNYQGSTPVKRFDVKTCRSKLAEHYKRTATVPTSVWSKTSPVDIHQIYTRLSWVKEEQTPAGSSQSELSHYTDVFTANKNGVVPKRILVQGQTGIGKSTFVKKLTVDWAELDDVKTGDKQTDVLKQFELLVAVNLKEVSKTQNLKDVVSRSSVFPREEKHLIDSLLDYIIKNQEKVLLVFDGYDEYRCGTNSEIYEIFRGNELRNCCVLITTRISKADELRGFKDIHAKITGFSEEDRNAFVRRMLGGEKEAIELGWLLERENLQELSRVPLLLLFFCTLWKKGKLKSFPETKTKLFLAIVQYVLDHSQRKRSPVCFGKVQDFKEILAEIGKVALECLLNDDHVFEYDQLSAAILGEESLIIGLLQVTEYAENLRPAGMVSFIHKSIQEFLAAWYITYKCVPEGNLGGIEQFANTLQDCQAWENVSQFLCGLSDDGAVKVFQHLTSVRISDPTLDLSKTIPDVESETDVPLCDVTVRQKRFSDLVFDSFREVQSKAQLVRHWLDCTAGVVLVTPDRRFSDLIPKLKHLNQVVFSEVFFICYCIGHTVGVSSQISITYELLEFLDCLHVPLRITKKSAGFLIGDFLRTFKPVGCIYCAFDSILHFRNDQSQFYITELFLECDNHARLFTETMIHISVPSLASTLCSKQSCCNFLRFLRCSGIMNAQTLKELGAVVRNCKHLKSILFGLCKDGICELLEQVQNTSTISLTIGYPSLSCLLTSAGAERLAGVLPRFNNITALNLKEVDCCAAAVNKLVSSITHKNLEELILTDISLTPAAAAVLGRSLPEISSLRSLGLTGVNGSILQVEEMEALFGGFNKTFPTLNQLHLNNFNARGSLAPLTERFHFFPNLTWLELNDLNMDERDLHGLLESLRSSPNLWMLSLGGNPLGDRDRVESIVQQALPRVELWYW
ncbi:NLR family CARD domain-containing protein 4-like isoform X1 [Oculina patagonica]